MNITTPVTDDMVSRFLGWVLPADFNPDYHISFDREKASTWPNTWPTGTNLLTAGQARAMLEYVVGADASRAGTLLDAMKAVTFAMQADLGYAWSWHCNIAMAAVDAGCPHDVANEGAARFLQLLANVDIRKHPGFADTQLPAETAPDTRPKQAAATAAPSVEPENKQLDDQLTGKLTDQAIEDYVKANGLNAPRVTLAEFDANIVHTEVLKHVTHSGQVLRWATLTTRNGFAVTGRPSCSASSENDNPPLGVKMAIDNARSELWPLMGYALRERLASAPVAHHPV